MEIQYHLIPKNVVFFEKENSKQTQKITIDDSTVLFQIGQASNLEKISVIFNNVPMQFERPDLINPYYPTHKEKAYKIFSYVLNRIFLQTAQNPFDLKKISDITKRSKTIIS